MNRFMKIAINEARDGVKNGHGGPFGAVIVRDGKVIAKAHNEVLNSNDPTAHAEVVAIRKASFKLNKHELDDCELYTTGEPCPMCLSAIHWARIKKVYYGFTKEDAKKIGFDDSLIYEIIKGNRRKRFSYKQVDRKECLKVIDFWKNNEGKLY